MTEYSQIAVDAIDSVWSDLLTDSRLAKDVVYYDYQDTEYSASAKASFPSYSATSITAIFLGIQRKPVKQENSWFEKVSEIVMVKREEFGDSFSYSGATHDYMSVGGVDRPIVYAEQYLDNHLLYFELEA